MSKREKVFFAKSVRCIEGEGQLLVGFADDPLDSTQFLSLCMQRTQSGRKNYVLQIDNDDRTAENAVESWNFENGLAKFAFSPEAKEKLKFESASIEFTKMPMIKLNELRSALDEMIGDRKL